MACCGRPGLPSDVGVSSEVANHLIRTAWKVRHGEPCPVVVCLLEHCAQYLALLTASGTEVSVTCVTSQVNQEMSLSGRGVVREAFLKRWYLR